MKTLKLTGNFADNVYFIWDCTHKQFCKHLSKKWPTCEFKPEEAITGLIETILDNNSKHYFVWVDSIRYKIKSTDFVTSAYHELAHLVFSISRNLGIDPSKESSEEFFTYLQEDYFEQINKRLNILK